MNIKGSISAINNDPDKCTPRFMQQGVPLLDSDYNNNVIAFINALQKESRDVFGEAACVGNSFRISRDLVIDHMIEPELWQPIIKGSKKSDNKEDNVMLDTNNIPYPFSYFTNEKGSILVKNASGIEKKFDKLDLSKFRLLFIKFKTSSSSHKDNKKDPILHLKLILFSTSSNSSTLLRQEYFGKFNNMTADVGGFYQAEFNIIDDTFSDKKTEVIDLSNIVRLSIEWDDDEIIYPVSVGLLTGEPFITVIGTDAIDVDSNWLTIYDASNSLSVEQYLKFETFNSKETICKKEGLNQIFWDFPKTKNFNGLNQLRFTISNTSGEFVPTFFILDSSGKKTEFSTNIEAALGNEIWTHYSISLKKDRNGKTLVWDDLIQIKTIGFTDLPEDVFFLSEILGAIDFEKDFIISGDFSSSIQSGKMYVNGIPCIIDHWETYLSQKDYLPVPEITSRSSLDNPTDKSKDNPKNSAKYMVIAHTRQLPVTYIEDQTIKEKAINLDTTTTIRTVWQIKIQEIPGSVDISAMISKAKDELVGLKGLMHSRLSTFDTISDSLSPLDTPADDMVNHFLENRLYRIQIHDSGVKASLSVSKKAVRDSLKNKATFKWSNNNASTAFRIKNIDKYEAILEGTDRNIENSLKIGSLIEIIDGIDELTKSTGQLRRLTDIDLTQRKVSWAPNLPIDYSEKTTLHDPISIHTNNGRYPRYCSENNLKIVLWDGINYVDSKENEDGSICLIDDSNSSGLIRVRFEPGVCVSGDCWNFTTRNNGKIEQKRKALPNSNDDYALLGLLSKEEGEPIEILADLRNSFVPLVQMKAIDVIYDNNVGSKTVQGALQNLFENRTFILAGSNKTDDDKLNDIKDRTFNKLYMESGEMELNIQNELQRFSNTCNFQNAYEDKPILIYNIKTNTGSPVDHKIQFIGSDEKNNRTNDSLDNSNDIPLCTGFKIETNKSILLTWMALGLRSDPKNDGKPNLSTLDMVFKLIFGMGLDELQKEESAKTMNLWYEQLEKLAGRPIADKARKNWNSFLESMIPQLEQNNKNSKKEI